MLVDPEELEAGVVARRFRQEANRLNKLGKRDNEENMFTVFAVKVPNREAKPPQRYGRIFAPMEYMDAFLGIYIRVRLDKGHPSLGSQ
jgi:hypothetical protein